jgi:hypothetical protein
LDKVIAIEASPIIYGRLLKNLRLNRVANERATASVEAAGGLVEQHDAPPRSDSMNRLPAASRARRT